MKERTILQCFTERFKGTHAHTHTHTHTLFYLSLSRSLRNKLFFLFCGEGINPHFSQVKHTFSHSTNFFANLYFCQNRNQFLRARRFCVSDFSELQTKYWGMGVPSWVSTTSPIVHGRAPRWVTLPSWLQSIAFTQWMWQTSLGLF